MNILIYLSFPYFRGKQDVRHFSDQFGQAQPPLLYRSGLQVFGRWWLWCSWCVLKQILVISLA